jgi:hypothetical protein
MSWIAGCVLRDGAEIPDALLRIHPTPLLVERSARHYLAAGGHPQTCVGDLGERASPAFAAVGLGITRDAGRWKAMDRQGWMAHLQNHSDGSGLQGHFVGVRRDGDRLRCFSDPLGVRSFYIAETPAAVFFSTRLDWTAALAGTGELDLAAFGSYWLATNQLSYDSLIRGITRLGPGAEADLSASPVTSSRRAWVPTKGSSASLEQVLDEMLSSSLLSDREISLGLSGGMDSRVLLAMLVSGNRPFSVHVWGDPGSPDVSVARRIGAGEEIRQRHFDKPLPGRDEMLALLREYVSLSGPLSAASFAVKTRYYGDLERDQKLVLDGGFGEIGRAKYMNRLLITGSAALRSGNPAALAPYLVASRADVFTREALRAMRAGMVRDIGAAMAEMPSVRDVGPRSFADLFAVRYRLPNAFGLEQPRIDEQVPGFMPFAQPAFVAEVLNAPVAERKWERAYRRIIRENAPRLRRYPLANGSTWHPYGLPLPAAVAWAALRGRVLGSWQDGRRTAVLKSLEEPVRDLAATAGDFPGYDARKVQALVEAFYGDRQGNAAALDWWLTFEIWRRACGVLR